MSQQFQSRNKKTIKGSQRDTVVPRVHNNGVIYRPLTINYFWQLLQSVYIGWFYCVRIIWSAGTASCRTNQLNKDTLMRALAGEKNNHRSRPESAVSTLAAQCFSLRNRIHSSLLESSLMCKETLRGSGGSCDEGMRSGHSMRQIPVTTNMPHSSTAIPQHIYMHVRS